MRSGSGTVALASVASAGSASVSFGIGGLGLRPGDAAAPAAELDLLFDAQEVPDPLDCLIGQMLLDPIGTLVERRLHVGVEQLLALALQAGAALLVERLGDSNRRDNSSPLPKPAARWR